MKTEDVDVTGLDDVTVNDVARADENAHESAIEDINLDTKKSGTQPNELRSKINMRERKRMRDLNVALDSLREVMPYANNPSVRKLSKIATLTLARNYIQMLTKSVEELKQILEEIYRSNGSNPYPRYSPLRPFSHPDFNFPKQHTSFGFGGYTSHVLPRQQSSYPLSMSNSSTVSTLGCTLDRCHSYACNISPQCMGTTTPRQNDDANHRSCDRKPDRFGVFKGDH